MAIKELRERVGQGRTLLRQVDAELDDLRIRDRSLARRLRAVLAATAESHDVPDDDGPLPVDAGAALAFSIVAEVADSRQVAGDFTADEAELLRLDEQLRERRGGVTGDRSSVEGASVRSLLRQAVRGRGDRA
ncbi:hypothetical protein ASG90_10035 [Nocardioides sp. Soil797]|nr:hypothetical protein ASG90_10035 [Nocardioides sp. Soil797]